ncbi:MAG: formylglycine-generating enzyme family protein [Pirellulaceae bacterium]
MRRSFVNGFRSQKVRTYRLPTEAEWEYACRAGTTTEYSFGDGEAKLSEYAWNPRNTYLRDTGEGYTRAVGQKRANGFGLYDMHGNVWEWCGDWYSADYYDESQSENPLGPVSGKRSTRVLRGGAWNREATRTCVLLLASEGIPLEPSLLLRFSGSV